MLQRQIVALKQRVTWLERALRPKPAKAALAGQNAGLSRDLAEAEARRKAIDEFLEEKDRQWYLENPQLLKQRRKRDREINAFLRSRGLKPIPSRLPKGLGRSEASSSRRTSGK